MLNLFEYSRNFEMTNLAQSGSQSASITEKETLIQELRALTALEEKKIYKEPVERLINEFDGTNSIRPFNLEVQQW